MKKSIYIFCLFIVWNISSYAQTVNNVPIKDIDVEYIQIVGTARPFSNKISIVLDFGQTSRFLNAKENHVRDDEGNLVIFNSMIDALNFFSTNGYEFKHAYAISVANQNVYHYLLKRKEFNNPGSEIIE